MRRRDWERALLWYGRYDSGHDSGHGGYHDTHIKAEFRQKTQGCTVIFEWTGIALPTPKLNMLVHYDAILHGFDRWGLAAAIHFRLEPNTTICRLPEFGTKTKDSRSHSERRYLRTR
jgi:hypothetical protein